MTLRRIAAALAIAVALVAAYLLFWPVPANPVAWSAPTPPGFTGPFAPNTRLSGLHSINLGSECGPEHIAIGPDGKRRTSDYGVTGSAVGFSF